MTLPDLFYGLSDKKRLHFFFPYNYRKFVYTSYLI